MEKPKPLILFSINSMLMLFGITTAYSGLTIMLHYHMGHPGAISDVETCWGLHYSDCLWIHKSSAITVTLLMGYHILLHFKWYKNVLLKKLMAKNKQVIVLSVIFAIALLSGFTPWLLQLSNSNYLLHRFLLEIHDKTGILLIVFLVLHVIKRINWFKSTYAKIKS